MSNQSNQAGKGDKYRPVKKNVYDENYDDIEWSNNKKQQSDKKQPPVDKPNDV